MNFKELFNGTVITEILNDLRIALGKPGEEGSKNITWSDFLNVLRTVFVGLTGNQTIQGEKTFTGKIVGPAPTNPNDLATKEYVDNNGGFSGDHNDLPGRSVAGAHPATAVTESSSLTGETVQEVFDNAEEPGVNSSPDFTDLTLIENGTTGAFEKTPFSSIQELLANPALKVFYVDSNNPQQGDGSVVNPFQTIDQAYTAVIGTGTAELPENSNSVISVQAGNYSTALNLAIHTITYSFEGNGTLTYTGSDYLFDTSAFLAPSGTRNCFVLGRFDFETTTGGIVYAQGTASDAVNGNPSKELYFECNQIYSNNTTTDDRPAVKVDCGATVATGYRNANRDALVLVCKQAIITTRQTTIRLGFGATCRLTGIGYPNITKTNWNNSKDITKHVMKIEDVERVVVSEFGMIGAYIRDYIDIGGTCKSIVFSDIVVNTPGDPTWAADSFLRVVSSYSRALRTAGDLDKTTQFTFNNVYFKGVYFFAPDAVVSEIPDLETLDMNYCNIPRYPQGASNRPSGVNAFKLVQSDIKLGVYSSTVCFNIINGDLNIDNQVILSRGQANTFFNPASFGGYITAGEDLTIPTGGFGVVGNWQSPTTAIVDASVTSLFDYTTNPGQVTYIGEADIVVKCVASVSISSTNGNLISGLQWVKNNLVSTSRYVTRKISTGGDVGAVSVSLLVNVSSGDTLDFFLCASAATTLTIEKAEFAITQERIS